MTRLSSLDTMRGLIIVIMAIDHARGFIARNHPSEWWGRGLPDYGGDVLAFLTRLITHLCAPGFLFLMGIGMVLLAASRTRLGWSYGRIVRFLALRGAALVVLEQVLENPSFSFATVGAMRGQSYGAIPSGIDGTPVTIVIVVLYSLGCALIFGSPLIRWRPSWLVGAAAVVAVAGELFTPPASQVAAQVSLLRGLLFVPGQSGQFMIVYPALAWLPSALLGMAFGRWLADADAAGRATTVALPTPSAATQSAPPSVLVSPSTAMSRAQAFQRLAIAGVIFLALFVVLRAAGGFGNLTPAPPSQGWIGFFNLVKYPPSITFVLFTLGVDFLLLVAIERWRVGETMVGRVLQVYGTVPFFFFIVHLWLYGAIGRIWFSTGTTIARMYWFWLLGLVLLYLPCRWYGAFKQSRPPDSLFRML
jgi:uncharacterized membrane protein